MYTLHPVGATRVEEADLRSRALLQSRAARGCADLVDHPVLVHLQLGGIDPVRGEDPDRRGRRGEHDISMREVLSETLRAPREPTVIDLAGTSSGVHDDATRVVVAVDEELSCADPPEVVHRHDDSRP